ncbi:MAG: hypothetical protein ACYDCA_03395 [Candidatus Tyrphobacter sp.]
MSSLLPGGKAAALIDAQLLDPDGSLPGLVKSLLAHPPPNDAARPFYEGMRVLGPRTPQLAVLALRLVLAGRRADDASVRRLRTLVEHIRAGGSDAAVARREYAFELEGSPDGT